MMKAIFADNKGSYELNGIESIILDGDCYRVFFNDGTDERQLDAKLVLVYTED